jgi:hypothetical protein
MATLVIDLQEGFADDTVSILVNGQEVFHKKGVSTDYSIGRAEGIESQVPAGKSKVEVKLPARNLTGYVDVEVENTKYVGVKVLAGRIEFKISDEMFLYF